MSIRPTHRQLEYLVAVTDTGHFSAAARRCHVSQPTLSTQIQLLEDRLQAKLLERSPGGARPTPLGEIVVRLSRNVLSTLDEIRNVTRNAAANLGGLIRLGTPSTIGPYFLPLIVPRLHADYPGLELHIREERPPLLERAIVAGTLDCALTRPPDAQKSLVFQEVMAEPLQLGIPADHPLAAQRIIRPDMLKGERMVSLGAEHGMPRTMRDFYASVGAVLKDDYEGTSLDGLRQMVSIGMGMALLPKLYIASNIHSDSGVALRDVEGWTLNRSVGLAWRDGSVRSAQYLQLLLECRKALDAAQGAPAAAAPAARSGG